MPTTLSEPMNDMRPGLSQSSSRTMTVVLAMLNGRGSDRVAAFMMRAFSIVSKYFTKSCPKLVLATCKSVLVMSQKEICARPFLQ